MLMKLVAFSGVCSLHSHCVFTKISGSVLRRWLKDNRGSVCVLCVTIDIWLGLWWKEEPLENNWALAPMDQSKRYNIDTVAL